MGNKANRNIFQDWPIFPLLLLSFFLVSLLPIIISSVKVYESAWDNAWREVNEKHQLLAKNLASPIYLYIHDRIKLLRVFSDIAADISKDSATISLGHIFNDAIEHEDGFHSILLLRPDGEAVQFKTRENPEASSTKLNLSSLGPDYSVFIKKAFAKNEGIISTMLRDPFSGAPTIYITAPLHITDSNNFIIAATLDIKPIETLRRNIRFGMKGHSAIVDNTGRVVAHPNPDWMNEIKDLSNLSIVKKMLSGQSGVMEFYSPFIKENMVAGFTAIPELGWGVMVPQPKSEINAQVYNILFSEFRWAILGLAIAVIVAIALARWITLPINTLAKAAIDHIKCNFEGEFPKTNPNAPREINYCFNAFREVVTGLTKAKTEVTDLNNSLQQKVETATRDLMLANERLTQLTQIDHLTQVNNRRFLEDAVNRLLGRRIGDDPNLCILMIDVDHFKTVNDLYGHAAGDSVLVDMAAILKRHMRKDDIVGRFAGDEFVVVLRSDIEVGRKRAESIKVDIESHPFMYQDKHINATVSIGLIHYDLNSENSSLEEILRKADKAMYAAKSSGRNAIAEVEIS